MNADIPMLRCLVRREIICGPDAEGFEDAYAFAIQSIKGRAIAFHVMLQSGAHYRGIPLPALTLNRSAAKRDAGDLAFWDCFSSRPEVTVFDYLRDHECVAHLPTKGRERGVYLFTVDWLPDSAERPGFILQPDQNKCGHMIALESGCIAMLPTNKIAWRDGYFIGSDPRPEGMGYRVQSEVYHAESATRDFSKSSWYFY